MKNKIGLLFFFHLKKNRTEVFFRTSKIQFFRYFDKLSKRSKSSVFYLFPFTLLAFAQFPLHPKLCNIKWVIIQSLRPFFSKTVSYNLFYVK